MAKAQENKETEMSVLYGMNHGKTNITGNRYLQNLCLLYPLLDIK